MPRDSNGVCTLVDGNPVEPLTVIESDWANSTLEDIADMLTDSLSRSGLGAMLTTLQFSDGTEMNPGQSWTNEPTSGFWRADFNDFWFSVGNDNVFNITKDGVALASGKTATGFTGGEITDTDYEMPTGTMLGRTALGTGPIEALTFEIVAEEVAPFIPGVASVRSHGQCRLVINNATTIALERWNGLGGLIIDGTMCIVPTADVTITNAGLAADTTYFVYAFMNVATMTLELSATAPTDGDGIRVKTGDATRTLVGMVRTNGSTQFTDSTLTKFVRTWFNDQGIASAFFISQSNVGPDVDWVEMDSASKLNYLAWDDETILLNANCWCTAQAALNHFQFNLSAASAGQGFVSIGPSGSGYQGAALSISTASQAGGSGLATVSPFRQVSQAGSDLEAQFNFVTGGSGA